jgi:aminoglycoside phosphotransferase (APT) family kinase protein
MTVDRDEILRWAVEATLAGGEITGATTLREPDGPWRLTIGRHDASVEIVLKARPLDWRPEFEVEIAALELAEAHNLPTPRLLESNVDGDLGVLVSVVSVVAGTSRIPEVASVQRLRASGAAAASLHQVRVDPAARLPIRTRQMPWIDWTEERRAGRSPTTPLLDEVDRRIRAARPPTDAVFVHGDLWQGNLMFEGDACTGIVDLEAAGVGHPGIDVGSLRWDAAILFDLLCIDEVLAGWEAASGRTLDDVPYWDLVAGANTPTDLSAMVDAIAQQGRPDLDGPTLTTRRDTFLEQALAAHER